MIVYMGSSRTGKTNTCGKFKTVITSGGWGQGLPGKFQQGASWADNVFYLDRGCIKQVYVFVNSSDDIEDLHLVRNFTSKEKRANIELWLIMGLLKFWG